jgi:hypothetical protein
MIEEGVVSMLYSGMPTAFWGEALTPLIHTSNRLLFTSALPDMTISILLWEQCFMSGCPSRGTSEFLGALGHRQKEKCV